MYTYALTASMSDRANLDEVASGHGYEDANAHYPDGILSGNAIAEHANSIVDQTLDEDEDVTDDQEEYRARYVASYVQAYTEQIASRHEDEA